MPVVSLMRLRSPAYNIFTFLLAAFCDIYQPSPGCYDAPYCNGAANALLPSGDLRRAARAAAARLGVAGPDIPGVNLAALQPEHVLQRLRRIDRPPIFSHLAAPWPPPAMERLVVSAIQRFSARPAMDTELVCLLCETTSFFRPMGSKHKNRRLRHDVAAARAAAAALMLVRELVRDAEAWARGLSPEQQAEVSVCSFLGLL